MSADSLRKYLETHNDKQVKAILPVHLYGQMSDMDPIMAIAEEYGLIVFEDACQAHGSEYFSKRNGRWQKAGSVGRAAAFSFYPGKNLGACGEAGAVTTNDERIAQRIRMIRDHGQNKKYHHAVEGYNGRLDSLQAALLRVKLPHLSGWNAKRRSAAAIYDQLLKTADAIRTPLESDGFRSNYHLYVIRTAQRDALQQHLAAGNIGTGLHYPIPLHLQQGYQGFGYHAGDFPISEKLSREILSLPMYPQILREQQEEVVAALLQFDYSQSAGEKVLQRL